MFKIFTDKCVTLLRRWAMRLGPHEILSLGKPIPGFRVPLARNPWDAFFMSESCWKNSEIPGLSHEPRVPNSLKVVSWDQNSGLLGLGQNFWVSPVTCPYLDDSRIIKLSIIFFRINIYNSSYRGQRQPHF